ncbi:hypothetical protein [Sphingomonas fuzhouensis]|uniref:hypothetical protein n=1 Tax=Sphingomonas fuzhouensis TaxID=3106033 RepID=UPI002AFF9FED|nr:hypothetical protein [Sphingomonas sp. SGZ-02]
MRISGFAAMAALAITGTASARDLPVPADKGWMHAQTRLIVRPVVAGLPRTDITDATTTEHDVTVNFASPDKDLLATLFLFHPARPNVPLWFDRSRIAIEERPVFEKGAPASADPIAFAPLGSGPAVALRQSYSVLSSPYRSTALAVMPMGEWMLVVRLSARKLTADALDAKMSEMIAALKPAIATTPAYPGPAAPIMPCTEQTDFAHMPKAKTEKPNGADTLATLLLSAAFAAHAKDTKSDTPAEPEKPVPPLCRDGAATTRYGVYRNGPVAEGYTLALFDAGRTVDIFPSVMSQVDRPKNPAYAVRLNDVEDNATSFSSFAALPRPEQVFDLVMKGTPNARVKGTSITIDSKSLGGS